MRFRLFRQLIGPKAYAPVDRWLLTRTGGSRGLAGGARRPTLLLTTTGRRSGEPRSVALLYVPAAEGFVVVGSNWGAEHHPAWSGNLLADARATAACREGTFTVHARLCGEDEVARRWPALVAAMPVWDTYRGLTEREMRVFVLERVSSPET